MKTSLAGPVAFATALAAALCITTTTRGDIRARAFVSFSGVDTQGTFLPPLNDVIDDTAPQLVDTGDLEITGFTDIGSAKLVANASGAHGKQFAGLFVSGEGQLTRPTQPPVIPVTGSITASAQAFVEYKDELTFNFPAPLADPAKVSGYLNLTGDMFVAEAEEGPSIGAQASVGVTIFGTGLTTSSYGLTTVGLTGGGFSDSVSNVALFSFDVSGGQAKMISFQTSLTGGIQLSGANFSVQQGALATADFGGDFTGSLDWGGITSVVNARTGQPLANWTVTSKSGFDYTQVFPPVPEPSAATLLLTAVAGGAARRRRQMG
jgi:hypothetical protein